MDDQPNLIETWNKAKEHLAGQMTRATFDTWLANTWVESVDGAEWVIGVQNAYALDWLQNRLATVISRALAHVAGGPVAVRFVVGRDPGAAVRRLTDPDQPITIDESGPILEAVREERLTLGAGGAALQWSDFYIKLKVAFRKRALGQLKGAQLSVFLCLALHVDRDGIAKPGGIEAIMHETRYSRGAVCSALADLERAGLIVKMPTHHGPDHYQVLGYAWFGQQPAPSLWELSKSKK